MYADIALAHLNATRTTFFLRCHVNSRLCQAAVNGQHNDARDEPAISPLTVSLLQSLTICSRRKHRGVSGKSSSSRSRKGAEDFQVSSHVFPGPKTLCGQHSTKHRATEGGKRSAARCNIVSSSSTALLPPPRRDTLSATSESHIHRGGTDTKRRLNTTEARYRDRITPTEAR